MDLYDNYQTKQLHTYASIHNSWWLFGWVTTYNYHGKLFDDIVLCRFGDSLILSELQISFNVKGLLLLELQLRNFVPVSDEQLCSLIPALALARGMAPITPSQPRDVPSWSTSTFLMW